MALHRHTVLIVEDDPLIRLTLADCLQDEGYDVLEASNVLEAIAVLGRHGKIDAMITDIDMPGSLNGLDLARLLRGSDSRVVIIVTSGGHVVAEDNLPCGGRFMPKPYRMSEVLAVLGSEIAKIGVAVSLRLAV